MIRISGLSFWIPVFNAFTYITLNNWNLTLHKNGYSEYEQSTFLLLNYSLIIALLVICLINYNTELFCQWIITVSVESAIHIPPICTHVFIVTASISFLWYNILIVWMCIILHCSYIDKRNVWISMLINFRIIFFY